MSKFLKWPKLCKREPVGDVDVENRNRNKSQCWSNIKWPCKKNSTEEDEDVASSGSSNIFIIPEEDEEPETGWKSWFTLRNTVFGFSILDLTVSLICGCYFLVLYILMSLANPSTLDDTRHIELDYTAASICGLFVLISIDLLVAVIKFKSILAYVWLLVSTVIYIILVLAYLTRIGSWKLMGYEHGIITIVFLIGGIYKFVENFIVYRWIKVIKLRVRPSSAASSPEEVEPEEDPDVEPVNPIIVDPNILHSSSSSSSSESEAPRQPEMESRPILIHPLHNAPYREYMGYGQANADGGLFDFGRSRPHYRGELPRPPDAVDSDYDL